MYNMKQTLFIDGSSEIMVSDRAFGSDLAERDRKEAERDRYVITLDEYQPLKENKVLSYIKCRDDKEASVEIKDKERSVKESIRRSKKHVDIIGRANRWTFFITLTFNPNIVDSFSYEESSKYLERWLDKMKHRYPDMKYLVVFEKHKSGRWHAHGLLADCRLSLVDSGKTKNHTKIYNIEEEDYKYGFTTVSYVRSTTAAGSYISKYIGKALGEVPENAKRYWASRNCINEKDCTVKRYVQDKPKESIMKFLYKIAERISKSYIETIDNTVTYFHLPAYLDIDDLIIQFASAV